MWVNFRKRAYAEFHDAYAWASPDNDHWGKKAKANSFTSAICNRLALALAE